MIKASVYNQKGEQIEELSLNDAVFGVKVKPEVIQQVVVAQQANARENLAHTKTKGEVRGGGKKPWKQKGTGRARHGSSRSPIWRHGGITFGPRNDQNYSLKINKKVKRKATLMCLSDKAANEKILVLDTLDLSVAKTKEFFTILQNLKLRKVAKKKAVKSEKTEEVKAPRKPAAVLVILPGKNQNVIKASRNIERVEVIQANSLNVVDLLKAKYLVVARDSVKKIEELFA